MKKEINWDKVFKWYCICAPVVVILFWILFLIVIPAYESYKIDTNYTLWKEDLREGKVAGYTYHNGTIVLLVNSTMTLRHELCHSDLRRDSITMNIFAEEMRCSAYELMFWKKVNLTSLEWEK